MSPEGESMKGVFPVVASSDSTVADPSRLVMAEKAPEFDDVATDRLTFWSISIADIDGDDEAFTIMIDNVSTQDQVKLKATRELSDVFIEKLLK
ncbi:hypothetical protein BGZ95_012061 [Linnemannia exigua]|uniref:Crinkler effector protein N-terminal domain-containing protein n=1 Tax=Linnemannia exigua TaxID=604196 RepID=A0AAD4D8Z5_9FUNG|nr:hypothetical protein BGZ95_012061 [Linnemannia exigua]